MVVEDMTCIFISSLSPSPPLISMQYIDRVHLVNTLLHQAHLSPLPQPIRPTYWNYDHSLRLYPLPHALIIGDSTDPWLGHVHDCIGACPGISSSINATARPTQGILYRIGSFSGRGEFTLYYPAGPKKVEPSQLPDSALPQDDEGEQTRGDHHHHRGEQQKQESNPRSLSSS